MKKGYGWAGMILILFILFPPVTAVVQETTLKGLITTLDPSNGTMTISADAYYRCSAMDGTRNCSWQRVEGPSYSGRTPDPLVFTIMVVGDTVGGTLAGGEGGQWIGIGRLIQKGDIWYKTDLVGEISAVPAPFVGDYQVKYTTHADCKTCAGTICQAASAEVSIFHLDTEVFNDSIASGGSAVYNGRGNGQIQVLFLGGGASSQDCPGRENMPGPVPTSLFVVQVSPSGEGTMIPTLIQTSLPAATSTASLPPTRVLPTNTPIQFSTVMVSLIGAGVLVATGKR